MIGLIVTGHGRFASGLEEALNVIAGPAEKFAAVDFEIDHSVEQLQNNLQAALDSMADCESVLILSDLAGGSPFKTAVELAYPLGYEVIAGTNLGMLIEMNLNRQFIDDVHQLADQAVVLGKDQVQKFVYRPVDIEEDDDFGDGI